MSLRGVAFGAFCIIAILGFAGPAFDFVPDALLLHVAWPVACFALAMVAVLIAPRFIGPYNIATEKPRWVQSLALGALIAVLGGLLWNLCVLTLPWAWTRVMGAPQFLEVEARTHENYSKYSCDHRLEMDGLLVGVCISHASYEAWPDQRVRVRLDGRRSALGFSITDAHILRTADDSARQ